MSDQDEKSPYTVTVIASDGKGNPPSSSTFTQVDLDSWLPSTNPNCPTCQGKGQVTYFIPRPGGPPGNQTLPCHTCRKPKVPIVGESCSCPCHYGSVMTKHGCCANEIDLLG